MDTEIFKKAGLTESQAKGYIALIEHGKLTAQELAIKTGEKRTNAYAIADKLVLFGLATKSTDERAAKYSANHPSALEALAEKRRKILVQNEKQVKNSIGSLIDFFYQNTEMPGTRTLQGIDGIKAVYEDTLKSNNDIYLVRTTADDLTISTDYLYSYVSQRAHKGIKTFGLYPQTNTPIPYLSTREYKKLLITPTFIPMDTYTAPVEINVYGDKVAFISFSETQMATIIQSPPIAQAMRQLLALLSRQLS